MRIVAKIDNLANMDARFMAGIDLAMRRMATEALPIAASLAPVNTGALSKSGIVKKIATGEYMMSFFGGDRGRVYAIFVERGTKDRMSPRPYVKPAARKVMAKSNQIIRQALAEVVK